MTDQPPEGPPAPEPGPSGPSRPEPSPSGPGTAWAAAPGTTGPGDGDGWQRLHPLSPLLRGGVVLLAALGYAVSQAFDRVLSSFDGGGRFPDEAGPNPDGTGFEVAVSYPLLAVGALLLVVAVVAAFSWVSWRVTRFRLTPAQVELRSGLLFRQHRQVRLERIQAVETTRPLLARLIGLSQVVVQAAGGSDSHLTLAFLAEPRAEALRAELLELAGRSDENRGPDVGVSSTGDTGGSLDGPAPGGVLGDGVAGPAAVSGPQGEGIPVVSVPNGRLLASTLLHGPTIVALVAVLLAVVVGGISSEVFGVGPGLLAASPAILPAIFAFGVSRVRELLVHGNFAMTRTPTSLRMRHGLTELRASVVPLHRVQAVEAVQPLLWRPFGWWRMRVNVAGTGHGEQEESAAALLPVGTLQDVFAVLAPLGADPTDPLLHAALHGSGPDGGWTGPPPAARLFDPISWRRTGYALGPHVLHLRSGRLARRIALVPYARVQSLTIAQGPWERRRGLAEARTVSTPGPVSAVVRHLAVADAEEFLDRVGVRARVARRGRPVAASAPAGSSGAPDAPENAAPLAPDAPPLVD